ncbi:Protein/nucleic acid deglycase HchA like protein [Verticillium longisporum]|nr:Protein/nucleic acid deglycase HchA like protein [Verticillium longisporum]
MSPKESVSGEQLEHHSSPTPPIMSNDRKPVADQAEDDAWFPSPYSLTQYVAPKTDFAEGDADYAATAYKGGKWPTAPGQV